MIHSSEEGSRSEFSFSIDEELWEDIGSDHDQTLRAKCPHYEHCFYYNARRKAAQSQLLILNHHLLLADLMVKRETGGEAILPKYTRLRSMRGIILRAEDLLFRQHQPPAQATSGVEVAANLARYRLQRSPTSILA